MVYETLYLFVLRLTTRQAKSLLWLLLFVALLVALALDFATTRGPYLVNNATQSEITMNGIW
jgi:hypothetical protein